MKKEEIKLTLNFAAFKFDLLKQFRMSCLDLGLSWSLGIDADLGGAESIVDNGHGMRSLRHRVDVILGDVIYDCLKKGLMRNLKSSTAPTLTYSPFSLLRLAFVDRLHWIGPLPCELRFANTLRDSTSQRLPSGRRPSLEHPFD